VSAAEALKAVRAAGLSVRLDGRALVLEGSAPPDADLLKLISHHKASIVSLLQSGRDEWSVANWLNTHLMRSPPGRCLICSRGDLKHDPLLPHGTERTGHVWLHFRCWPAWRMARLLEAQAALAAVPLRRMPSRTHARECGVTTGECARCLAT
jgi:hypothetical protein